MGWKESSIKHEKIMFLANYLSKEFTFKELCDRYEISRKTGYKLIHRYESEGEEAFKEKSRTKHTFYNEMPFQIKNKLIELKHRFPKWGPAKLRHWLIHQEPDKTWPASSTIGDFLKKHGLVKKRKDSRRFVPPHNHPFLTCDSSNKVWSADFKGQFRLGTREYCYPLTVSDNYSRFLLLCDALENPYLRETMKRFEKVFHEYGLPDAIRTDNGQPFANVGAGGLSRLSIWWLKLGITHERIKPGHPEQNGRHERMHRTLKEATVQPTKKDFVEQQKCFDKFIEEYNYERPHEALKNKRPAEIYKKSDKVMPNKIPEIVYPDNFLIRKVRSKGAIKWRGKEYYLSTLLTGEPVGFEPIDEDRAIVHFSKLKLGIIDRRTDKIIRPSR